MSQVLEVTSAEQLTGHPHSLALTGPDRVTFVKAASREDARWWLELVAVFPRRHKRNATFPGGRASPSLPHLGRSASPQPPRPMRHLVGAGEGGGSPRTNFTTPPLKEERSPNSTVPPSPLGSLPSSLVNSGSSSSVGSNSSPRCSLVGVILKEDVSNSSSGVGKDNFGVDMVDYKDQGGGGNRPQWLPESSAMLSIGDSGARDALLANPRTEYLISSGSPPTRDKLRCEDKARARRDWRHERLRDIATALTDRSPESSLALPAEGLLHLKKGWLWHRESSSSDPCDQWRRRWWVLCGPSLLGYRDQDEEAGGAPLVSIELAAVTGYSELRTDTRFGFQVLWSGGPPLTLSAVTMGIRSNWLQALRKAAPGIIESPSPLDMDQTPSAASTTSSIPSSTSSSRHSTASSSQLTAAASAIINQSSANQQHNIRLRGDPIGSGSTMSTPPSCRLSTGSSSGGGTTPTTPRSGGMTMFSSDEEYRTASEGGRRDSMTDVEWMECGNGGGSSTSMVKGLLNRSKDQRCLQQQQQQQQQRARPHKLPRCQSSSRQSTLDSNVSSPDDDLDSISTVMAQNNQQNQQQMQFSDGHQRAYHRHSVADMRTRKLHLQLQLDENELERRRKGEMEKELEVARGEVTVLEEEQRRLRGLLTEATSKELKGRDAVYELEKIERDLTLKLEKMLREQKSLNRRLSESDEAIRESDERSATLNRELQAKQRIVASLQEELTCANGRCAASRLENDRLYKKLQELNRASATTPTITPPPPPTPPSTPLQSIAHLTNVDLDAPITALSPTQLVHHCLDLRMRFERAVAEIRALQQRLREAHAHADGLQLERVRFGQRVEAARVEYEGRLGMLRERVEDLTAKLGLAERQARGRGGVKGQREGSGSGGSAKMGRRSLSLKGRESFSVSKDIEDKVTLLEAKLLALEQPSNTTVQPASASSTRLSSTSRSTSRSKYTVSSSGRRSTDNGSPIDDRSLRRLRRKSLDGATASEPMKLLVRLNALEEKIGSGGGAGSGQSVRASSESLNNLGGGCGSGDGMERVEKNEIDNTLSQAQAAYLQFVTTIEPQSYSHLSPPNFDHIRELGRILRIPDVDNVLLNQSNTGSNDDNVTISGNTADSLHESAQSLVGQLERALQRQYKELYEKRVRLRERGELDSRAKMELLAEKIAFEDVIIARIFQSLPDKSPSSSSSTTTKSFLLRETIETAHLIHHLQSKLNYLLSPSSATTSTTSTPQFPTSIQHLTQVFSKHLLAFSSCTPDDTTMTLSARPLHLATGEVFRVFDETSLNELVVGQRKVHELWEEYQRLKLGELVERLVTDTGILVRDDSCALVDIVSGRVWEDARRRVSEELIQSEVRHVLMKTAQHYEHLNSSDNTSGYSFTLTALQRCQIEQWTDLVEEHLLSRIEQFITHLNNTYHSTYLSRQNSHTAESSRSHTNSSEALHEYADIIAHVALIDARIATALQFRQISGEQQQEEMDDGRDDVNEITWSSLNMLLDVDKAEIGEVSVVEFKAAVKVAKLICAGQVGAVVPKAAETGLTCARCKERQDMATWDANCANSLTWIGASYNSYDSFPERPPSDSTPSTSPTLPLSSPTPPTITNSTSPPPFTIENNNTQTYHHQIALLRYAFQQTLSQSASAAATVSSSTPVDTTVTHHHNSSHQTTRHLHLVENSVERLRVVCEQVLVAMERMHRTALQRMRVTHKEEMEGVRREKEQALAEETQATLAALDAMRKAHEAEVVKEVARFKQELSRQQASELLELRERLSVKCLEAAALQEQLGSATRQLAHAHQHILHIEQQRAPPSAT